MVSPLDGVSGLARIAGLVRGAVQQRAGGPAKAGAAVANATGGRPGTELLPVMLERRLKEIRGDDASRKRLLMRMLVESVLLEQFGHELGGDAKFQNVIDDVVEVVEGSDALKRDLEKVLEALVPR
jgi:hypothetical protein